MRKVIVLVTLLLMIYWFARQPRRVTRVVPAGRIPQDELDAIRVRLDNPENDDEELVDLADVLATLCRNGGGDARD